MAEDTPPKAPRRWWELFILYPTLAASLWAAIPSVWAELKAWRLGVHTSRLTQIEEQQGLWQRNLSCLRMKPVYTIVIDEGVEVAVTLCESGDALMKYQRNPETVSYTWIKYPTQGRPSEPQHSKAGDVVLPQSRVVYGATRCIQQQDLLVLWVLYDNEQGETCHLDVITTIKGVLLKTEAVPCGTCDT